MRNSIVSWERPLFGSLAQFRQELDSLFGEAGIGDIRSVPRSAFPSIDMGETPEEVRVLVLVPGVDAESLEITMHDGVLKLHGQRQNGAGSDSEQVTYHRRERFGGEFTRTVSLPEAVDPDAVEARFKDGLLTISMKKRAAAQPRRVEVKTTD
jgi:HSP20 family protein